MKPKEMYDTLELVLRKVFNKTPNFFGMSFRASLGDDPDYICILGDAICVYQTKETVKTLTGELQMDLWNVDTSPLVVNYPNEPDDVEIDEYGPFESDQRCIEFIVELVMKNELKIILEQLSIEAEWGNE